MRKIIERLLLEGKDLNITFKGQWLGSIPYNPSLEEFFREAKQRLLRIVPHKRGIEFGHLLNDLDSLYKDNLISEVERGWAVKILYKIRELI